MSTRIGAACAAAILSTAIVAAEQVPQPPTSAGEQSGPPAGSQQQPPPQRPAATPATGEVTMTGCVTREVAGQFALSNAVRLAASTAPDGSAGSTNREGTVGTAGSSTPATSPAAAGAVTYSLAGDRENELEKHVGQRVEIVGMLGTPAAGGTPGSGTSSAQPERSGDATKAPVTRPEGTTASGDANRGTAASSGHAPRLTIVSFRPVGGDCENR